MRIEYVSESQDGSELSRLVFRPVGYSLLFVLLGGAAVVLFTAYTTDLDNPLRSLVRLPIVLVLVVAMGVFQISFPIAAVLHTVMLRQLRRYGPRLLELRPEGLFYSESEAEGLIPWPAIYWTFRAGRAVYFLTPGQTPDTGMFEIRWVPLRAVRDEAQLDEVAEAARRYRTGREALQPEAATGDPSSK